MTDVGPDPFYRPKTLTASQAEALAESAGMHEVAVRPRTGAYLRDIWRYRHLMWSLAKGEVVSQHRDNYLGLLWSVITPIMLGIAYYLIFGKLLGLSRDVPNFISFLTIGLFTFTFLSATLPSGSRSLISKMGMMRSLAFPRILLPVVSVISDFINTLPAFLVLLLIAVWTGEPITLTWLLFPVALLIIVVMALGLAMILSRIVHAVRDLANLMPLLVRLLRYVSGVFFSIEARFAHLDGAPEWIGWMLSYQPVAVALTMVRESIMSGFPLHWLTWVVSAGWALLFLVVGFVVFWRGEGTYGRA